MTRKGGKTTAGGSRDRSHRPSKARIDELIAEATVDCYSEEEQLAGFFTALDDGLAFPFQTMVLGMQVTVESLDLSGRGIAVVCRRGKDRQKVALEHLPLPDPSPEGWEWVEAYRSWIGSWG